VPPTKTAEGEHDEGIMSKTSMQGR